MSELFAYTAKYVTELNGVKGVVFYRGINGIGPKIFVPFTGFYNESGGYEEDEGNETISYYKGGNSFCLWSSTLYGWRGDHGNCPLGYCLSSRQSDSRLTYAFGWEGFPVRAIER